MKSETFTTLFDEAGFPDLENVTFDNWELRITARFQSLFGPIYVVFTGAEGFRVLDEGNLLEFWPQDSRSPGWIWRIIEGGWFEQERRWHFGVEPVECQNQLDGCLISCAPPPEPTCEDRCFFGWNECNALGISPTECDDYLNDCLVDCDPPTGPDCDEICFLGFDECLSSGIDPVSCDQLLRDCQVSCVS